MLHVSMGIVDPSSSSIPALSLKDETVHSRHDAKTDGKNRYIAQKQDFKIKCKQT